MSPWSKKEYVELTALRYKKASRKRKTAILDEDGDMGTMFR